MYDSAHFSDEDRFPHVVTAWHDYDSNGRRKKMFLGHASCQPIGDYELEEPGQPYDPFAPLPAWHSTWVPSANAITHGFNARGNLATINNTYFNAGNLNAPAWPGHHNRENAEHYSNKAVGVGLQDWEIRYTGRDECRQGNRLLESLLLMDLLLWIVGAAICVFLLRWLSKKAVEPVIYQPLDQDLVRALLEALLYRGIEPTKLTFRESAVAEREVVFGKNIRGWNDIDITASIDTAKLPDDSAKMLVQELADRGIPYSRERSRAEGTGSMHLSFGQDIGLAHFVLNIVFERAFGLRLKSDCVAFFNPHLLPLEGIRRAGVERA